MQTPLPCRAADTHGSPPNSWHQLRRDPYQHGASPMTRGQASPGPHPNHTQSTHRHLTEDWLPGVGRHPPPPPWLCSAAASHPGTLLSPFSGVAKTQPRHLLQGHCSQVWFQTQGTPPASQRGVWKRGSVWCLEIGSSRGAHTETRDSSLATQMAGEVVGSRDPELQLPTPGQGRRGRGGGMHCRGLTPPLSHQGYPL